MKIELPGIIYEVTTKCNLNCKYCYNYWKRDVESNIEDAENCDPVKTLKQLFKMTKIPKVTFSGGEPTLENKLIDLIILSKLKNKQVTIITNGNLITEDLIQQYVKLNVNLFEITINSYNPNVHDKISGVPGSWNKTTSTIKKLLEHNANVVGVIVLTKYNFEGIEQTLEYIYHLGIKNIMINRYNIGGFGVNEPDKIVLGKKALKEVFTKANLFAQKNNIKLHSLVCTPVCILDPAVYPSIRFSNCSPNMLKRYYTLNRNGDLRYCNHSPTVIGNIYKQHIKDVLASNYLKDWQIITPQYCKECKRYEECFAGCRAASEQLGMGLEHADPILKFD